MENCIFCKIINNEIKSYKIYEDEMVLAFLDITSITQGHTLVVPKRHSKNIFECDDKEMAHLMSVCSKISKQMINKLDAKGINLISNINEVAGQSVMHTHVHLIPRYDKKEFEFIYNKSENNNTKMEYIVNKIGMLDN